MSKKEETFFEWAKKENLEVYLLSFHLNGGAEPPKYPGGFKINPFPAVPVYQYQGTTMALQKMSGMVFNSSEEVANYILSFGYTEQFAHSVANKWKASKLVKVSVVFVFENNNPIGWRFLDDPGKKKIK